MKSYLCKLLQHYLHVSFFSKYNLGYTSLYFEYASFHEIYVCWYFVVITVLPANDNEPNLRHRNSKTMQQQNLVGPFLENVNEDFACIIRNILPGNESTSFMFHFNGKLRLQSANDTGEVLQSNQADGTKLVEWKFTSMFHRSDNGGKCRCYVNWKAGLYSKSGLKSKVTENVAVTCKYSKWCHCIYC